MSAPIPPAGDSSAQQAGQHVTHVREKVRAFVRKHVYPAGTLPVTSTDTTSGPTPSGSVPSRRTGILPVTQETKDERVREITGHPTWGIPSATVRELLGTPVGQSVKKMLGAYAEGDLTCPSGNGSLFDLTSYNIHVPHCTASVKPPSHDEFFQRRETVLPFLLLYLENRFPIHQVFYPFSGCHQTVRDFFGSHRVTHMGLDALHPPGGFEYSFWILGEGKRVEAECREIPFKDTAFSLTVLTRGGPPPDVEIEAIPELARVTEPGGLFLVADHTPLFSTFEAIGGRLDNVSQQTLDEVLTDHFRRWLADGKTADPTVLAFQERFEEIPLPKEFGPHFHLFRNRPNGTIASSPSR